jgi:hypothetical protein
MRFIFFVYVTVNLAASCIWFDCVTIITKVLSLKISGKITQNLIDNNFILLAASLKNKTSNVDINLEKLIRPCIGKKQPAFVGPAVGIL